MDDWVLNILTLPHLFWYILLVGLFVEMVFVVWAIYKLIKHNIWRSNGNILKVFSLQLLFITDAWMEPLLQFTRLVFLILINDFVHFNNSFMLLFDFELLLFLGDLYWMEVLLLQSFIIFYAWVVVTHIELNNQLCYARSICNV